MGEVTEGARRVLRVSGGDHRKFLGDLVTNDLPEPGKLTYAALLTPQGKYLADFFLLGAEDHILIDVDESLFDALQARLTLYKLRADVTLTPETTVPSRGRGTPPPGALPDPRHPDLGWRLYDDTPQTDDDTDWSALRVSLGIPATGLELTGDSYILEMGFARLNGVSFTKGCYVGQEVTARMHHKTTLRKGLTRVSLSAPVPFGTPITKDGKEVGQVLTGSGDQALAYLRFDRAEGALRAGEATIEHLPYTPV